MIRRVMCALFGHQPMEHSYESGMTRYTYTECVRCAGRKYNEERGWGYDDA